MSKDRILSLPCWDSSVELEELPGGITNRNYKVVSAAGNRMARVCEDHRVLGIDRRNEVACQGAAAALGIAPEIVYHEEGILVSEFIEAQTLADSDVRAAAALRRLAQVLRQVAGVSEKYGIQIANVFHAGDGNLHPCLLFDERQPGALDTNIAAGAEVLKICVDAGGSLTGEHGVGLEKKNQMPLVFTDDDMAAMLQVRDAFAPTNRLNPGKIFPGGPDHKPTAHHAPKGMTV